MFICIPNNSLSTISPETWLAPSLRAKQITKVMVILPQIKNYNSQKVINRFSALRTAVAMLKTHNQPLQIEEEALKSKRSSPNIHTVLIMEL
jgi:hypothetical protein